MGCHRLPCTPAAAAKAAAPGSPAASAHLCLEALQQEALLIGLPLILLQLVTCTRGRSGTGRWVFHCSTNQRSWAGHSAGAGEGQGTCDGAVPRGALLSLGQLDVQRSVLEGPQRLRHLDRPAKTLLQA
jgi:hypothetical protein